MEKYRFIHHLHMLTSDDYKELVVSNTFRNVALAMISLFVPIFLLKKGFELVNVFYFELYVLVFTMILHFATIHIVCKMGLKKSLLIGNMLSVIYYILLYNYDVFKTYELGFLVLIGFIMAISTTFFWNAFHLYFMNATNRKTSKLGILTSIPAIFSIISPLLGSILITKIGFKFTFIIVAALVSIGSFVLFFSKEISPRYEMKIKDVFLIDKKLSMIYFMEGFGYMGASLLWPVFVFLSSIKIMIIGIFYLFSNILHAIFSYIAGNWADKYGNQKLVKFGAIGWGGSLSVRALQTSAISMSLVQNVGGVTAAILHVPLQGLFYKVSSKKPMDHIMNREFFMHLGRITLVILAIILIGLFPTISAVSFSIIVAGIVTSSIAFIIKEIKTLED